MYNHSFVNDLPGTFVLQCRVCGHLTVTKMSAHSEIQHRCTKCKAAPVLHRVEEKKFYAALKDIYRLEPLARKLYRQYTGAAEAGRLARSRDLYARYCFVQEALKGLLSDMQGYDPAATRPPMLATNRGARVSASY